MRKDNLCKLAPRVLALFMKVVSSIGGADVVTLSEV